MGVDTAADRVRTIAEPVDEDDFSPSPFWLIAATLTAITWPIE